jgi:hypothetical protein
MKKVLLSLALAVALMAPCAAQAGSQVGSGKNFGAGVQLGYPGNGLSFNWFMSKAVSIQIDASLWLKDNWTGLGARVDLLWWQGTLARGGAGDLVWYFGPGGNIYSFSYKGKGEADGYIGIGAEFPVGIGFRFGKAPIDINLEAVPILQIIDSSGTNINFDIAGVFNARYYF